MNFLPPEYKVPSNSNYMKLKDGENTFRVLSSAVVGYEYWNTDNKPVRSKQRWVNTPADIKTDSDGKMSIKHFWAFAVWNYEDKSIQILELTQKGVMDAIKALIDNKRWGNPQGYDITINRSGTGFDTEYIVQANPHSVVDPTILADYAKKTINLEGLFDGSDPFAIKKADAEVEFEIDKKDMPL